MFPYDKSAPDLSNQIERTTEIIGRGAYGTVYKGRWLSMATNPTPATIAIKVIDLVPLRDDAKRKRRFKQITRELSLWCSIQHENILPLLGIACINSDTNLPAFVCPWMENGNAKEFCSRNPRFPPIFILYDIINGLHYLHTYKPEIVHGDIKAVNVLINNRCEACLCDFGLSRFITDNTLWQTTATAAGGTARWMAPELMNGDVSTPTKESDIYAYAMTCYEILSGDVPFQSVLNDMAILFKVTKGQRPDRTESFHSDFMWDIITRCWEQEPKDRLPTEKVLGLLRLKVDRKDEEEQARIGENDVALAKVEKEMSVLKEKMAEALAKAEQDMKASKEEKEEALKALAKAEEELNEKDVSWAKEKTVLNEKMAEALARAEKDMKALREEKEEALKALEKAEKDFTVMRQQKAEAHEGMEEEREEEEETLATAEAEEEMKILREGDRYGSGSLSGQHQGLEKMERPLSSNTQIDSSVQDSEVICHPGTRQNVLKCAKDWIDDPTSTERIFWLHGPAGAGKSVITRTIVQSCGRQKVPAAFFFSSDASRNDGNRLFPMLAYELAMSIPAMKDHMFQYSLKNSILWPIETQFEYLLARPFRSLVEATSAQSCPVSVIDAVNRCRQLAPVIVIDGVDECTDEKLQPRFLNIIGNVVKDRSFPFRFLICSRPQDHIEDTLNNFKALILSVDLALDDTNRDVKKYLMDQFSSIASNRGLDATWPGQDVIENIVDKSSGNFLFALVVINVVRDEDNIPEDQLAFILNLKPPDRMSPFAVLDELYLEILRRQLYQDLVKTFLALLVGRIALSSGDALLEDDPKLHEDDPKLLNVSKEELHTKLRMMRSLLKFEPYIDVRHRSFLNFLNDPSRSGDYHVSKQAGTRRYLELVVDSIVLYVSRVIQNPHHHKSHHLDLNFKEIIKINCLPVIALSAIRDVSQPLVQIQDEILKLPDSRVVGNLLTCDKCVVFNVMRPFLLHVAIHRCIDAAYNEVKESVTKGKRTGFIPSFRPETMENTVGDDLDSSLSSLLTHLQETKLELTPSTTMINDTYSILRFDCADTAVKVRSMLAAQRLVDFLVCLIDEKYILSQYKPDGMSKAAQLVLNIFLWVPVLPQSLFLNVKRITHIPSPRLSYARDTCRSALMWRVLDQNYIHLEINLQRASFIIPGYQDIEEKWQQVSSLDPITVIELMLDAARAIKYLHSMGVAPPDTLSVGDVCLVLSLQPKIRIGAQFLDLINPCTGFTRKTSLYGGSVLGFGCFFYQLYFNTRISYAEEMEAKRRILATRPLEPKIPDYAWQLIQRCCAEDPRSRPTIDEVVKEMETWGT